MDREKEEDSHGRRGAGPYEHTQRGYLVIGAVLAVFVIIAASTIVFGPGPVPVIVGGLMVFLLALFSTLTVRVDGGYLSLAFGPIHLFRKSWPLFDITSVVVVRNPWYYGWGIRWTPHGPLYNISGYDAVEVTLSSGKKFHIGTDEPEDLKRTIEKAVSE